MRTHAPRWVTLRSIFAFTALLAAAAAHGQQNLNVTAANSGNNNIYSVNFAAGTTNVLNSDQKSLFSLESVLFIPHNDAKNAVFTLDLLAADNQKGSILSYPADFTGNPPVTVGTVVSKAIQYPTGLSVDAAGNLFVVNNAPGHSPLPQVWVLPSTGPGTFGTAVPLDSTHFGPLQGTVETLLAATTIGGDPTKCTSGPPARPLVCPGDLLVLTTNPASVLLYQGNGSGTGPLLAGGPTAILINQCPSDPPAGNCIPIGTVPGGITVWPFDSTGASNNSLLITAQSGAIQQYSFSGGSVTESNNFYPAGLPSYLYAIKTGYQNGLPRAIVVEASGNHGIIFELGPPNLPSDPIAILGQVTVGVGAPRGVAVTNAAQAQASGCQSVNGCNVLGLNDPTHNVLTHLIGNIPGGGQLQGNLVEDVCVVAVDPRKPSGNGACNDAPLLVNQVCPGWDNTGNSLFIPGYLCGASGGGTGFALIKTLTSHAQTKIGGKYQSEFNGTYVANSQDTTQLLPGANNWSCQPGGAAFGAFPWAPLAGEGTIAEGSSMVDLSSGCGTGHSGTGYTSLWAIGLALDISALELQAPLAMPMWNFAQTKYTNLKKTISNMTPSNITQSISTDLVNTSYGVSSGVPGCVDQSLSNFISGTTDQLAAQTADFQNAANLLTDDDASATTTCESIVEQNLGAFTESQNVGPLVLNPSGQMRSRLANLYYTLNTEVLGNPPPVGAPWPPPVSNSVSVSPQLLANTSTTTLSWALKDSSVTPATPCTLTSTDPLFVQLNPSASGSEVIGPWTVAGVTYAYTLTCPVPQGTVASGTTMSVATHLTIWPAVMVTVTPTTIGANHSVQVSWTPPAGATGCKLTGTGSGTLSGNTTGVGAAPYLASYRAVKADEIPGVTFKGNCTFGASQGTGSLTVTQ